MLAQPAQPGHDLGQLHFQLPALTVQSLQFLQPGLQSVPLRFLLGQQAAFVVAAAVFQLLQAVRQPVGVPAFVPGGDQGVQPTAQGLVLGHRQIGMADEARPAEHRLLHAQEHLAAVGRGQLRHWQAGGRFKGGKLPQGHPAAGGAEDGDVPALPVQIDPPLHGAARPGSVTLLVRQGVFGGFGPGVQAVEHGHQEGAPGALAPLVGSGEDVQPRLQGQRLMLQLAEGGRHLVNSHSRTSLPLRILREISAARRMRSAFSGRSSMAVRSIRK